jgi:hypothetical protein
MFEAPPLRTKQIVVITAVATAFAAWFYFDLGSLLQFEVLQQRIGEMRHWYTDNPLLAGLIYFAIYVGVVCQQYRGHAGFSGVADSAAGLGAGTVWAAHGGGECRI